MREDPKEAAGGPSWSFRRHRILTECARRYWFEYVAPAAEGVPPDLRERIGGLRDLVAFGSLRGALVHDEVSRLVPQLVKGEPVDLEAACREVDGWIAEHEAKAAERAVEGINGLAPEPAAYAAMRAEAREELARFVGEVWPTWAKLSNIEHEKFARFIVGHVPVTVRMDFVGRAAEGRLNIVEWKSGGAENRSASETQVRVYALWARNALGWDTKRVDLFLVSLASGETSSVKTSEPDVRTLEILIKDEWRTIANPGPRSSFPAAPEPAKCIACSFATLCPEADLSLAKRARRKGPITAPSANVAVLGPRGKVPPPPRAVMSAMHGAKVPSLAEQFNAGVALLRENRNEEAHAAFEFVTRAAPNQPDGWHNRGVALARLGRFRESLAAFDASIRLQREDSDSWDGRGVALGALARHEEALAAHDQALHITPGRADYWHNRGYAHAALGHPRQAIESFEKALALDRNRFDTWVARAVAQQKVDRPEDELASVEELVRIDPGSLGAWRWRADLLAKLGRPKEARAARLDLYRAGKGDPTLQFEHGVDLAKRGKDDKAVACFREAVRLDPLHRDAWAELGFVLARQGKNEEALAATEELLRLAPSDREASIRRARLLGELGRTTEALEAAAHAARLHPSAVAAWELMADLAKRAERLDMLERALRGALSQNRRDVPTLHDLAVVLGRQGRAREAFAAFDEALRIGPNSVEVLVSKGALLEAGGRLKEALGHYQEALRYHPGHKRATARKAEVEKLLGIAPPPPRPPSKPKPQAPRAGATSEHKRRRPRTSERRR